MAVTDRDLRIVLALERIADEMEAQSRVQAKMYNLSDRGIDLSERSVKILERLHPEPFE